MTHTPSTSERYHSLPDRAERDEMQDLNVYQSILEDPYLGSIDEADKKEVAGQTLELYLAAKANVAPVIAGFADELLKSAEGRQIIFAARDGLGAFKAADVMRQRFPEVYNAKSDDLILAYLTRKIVFNTPSQTLKEYLLQVGVNDLEQPILIADIGMYGSSMHDLQAIMPQVEAHYLISKNRSIEGYADDGQTRVMQSVHQVVGNPAVHFLEDTFSGLTNSPSMLIENEGILTPNFTNEAFGSSELLKRKYALKAITDYVEMIDHPPTVQEQLQAIDRLDHFLGDPEQYRRLMVPHIRG